MLSDKDGLKMDTPHPTPSVVSKQKCVDFI